VSIFLKNENNYFNSKIKKIFNIIDSPPKIDDSYSEEKLYRDENFNKFTEEIAKFSINLISITIKFEKIRKDKRYKKIENMLSNDLWFNSIYNDFSNIKLMTVKDFLRDILNNYIIAQHRRIMIDRKLRRHWFIEEGDKYIHKADAHPIWRPAKFDTIMNFLQDMNLIFLKNKLYMMTDEGKDLYNKLKNKYYV
jgi:hypothetical protein